MTRLPFIAALLWVGITATGLAQIATPPTPPCWPSEVGGNGTRSEVHVSAAGVAVGWWCREPRSVSIVTSTWVTLLQPAFAAKIVTAAAQLDRSAAAAAFWPANVGPLSDVPVAVWEPLLAPLSAAAPLPIVERWAVPKASSTASPPGTRPTYRPTPTSGVGQLVADGGRVAEGSPCDLAAAKHALGTSTFGSVLGDASKLALCTKVMP